MDESKNLFDITAFGMRVAVIPEGIFEKDGKQISYARGIKIQTGEKKYVKITALQAIALTQIFCCSDFCESIKAWAEEEKTEYHEQLKRVQTLII